MNLTNSQFHDLVDATQRNLEDIIDNGDVDIDLESSGGILTLTFENQHQVILSRQEPLKQLWLADRSGGFHFDYDSEKNAWYCAATEQTLVQMLSEILHAHTQHSFDLSSL
ncbi:MAG TPA: iron donor protein CyaY [Thiopseudomonas sp.]|nr:iron donor protein CyaY [Thiopseudomonas sp.]